MGLLNLFKSREATPEPLPAGTFTVDRTGRIITSTISSGVSRESLDQIAQIVLEAFRKAQEAQIPVQELTLSYAALTLTAKEMRGGAMIFLAPRKLGNRR